MKTLDRYFGITAAGSSITTEVFAGVSTFLALSYIFVVNPAILSEGGMDKSMVFFATIVGSASTTLLMGLWANKPFAVAPGLEMNAYVAFVVMKALGFTWQEAMGAVFWSGVLTIALNYTRVRVRIIDAIPDTLKSGLAASVGVFLVLIALRVAEITKYNGVHIQGMNEPFSTKSVVFAFGLLLVLLLKRLKIPGSVLLSIIGASLLAHFIGLGSVGEQISPTANMFSGFLAFDLTILMNPKAWSVILLLFILDFYGSIAKFIGLTRNTSIVDESGSLPKLQEALSVDAIGTVVGAGLGTSNLITFVESAVGIGEGGRTGLTAVICGGLMSLFLVLTPLVNLIPVVATTGPLLYVGWTLLPKTSEMKSMAGLDILSIAIMIIVTLWTFGLDKSMFAGFLTYAIGIVVTQGRRALNPYLAYSTALLLLTLILGES